VLAAAKCGTLMGSFAHITALFSAFKLPDTLPDLFLGIVLFKIVKRSITSDWDPIVKSL
jgi:hypothetical protein